MVPSDLMYKSVMMRDKIGWTFGRITKVSPNGFLVRRDDGLTTYVDKRAYGTFWRLHKGTGIHWITTQVWALYKVFYK